MTFFSLQKKLHAAGSPLELDVRCEIDKGAFIGLYGPSGAGKTSLLRMLAGLMTPDAGRVEVNGDIWYDPASGVSLPARKRSVGLVFQDYALFPNLTVEQNIAYGAPERESKQITAELLGLTALGGLKRQKVGLLSGGQQQRVALARALARKPQLLLLDEPLSAIDSAMRAGLRDMLLEIHQRFDITSIIVSHDIGEIVRLTSKTICLKNGRVEQFGASARLFGSSPAEPWLKAIFLSAANDGTSWHASVLLGEQVIQVSCLQEDVNKLQKGDPVALSFGGAPAFLRKLEAK